MIESIHQQLILALQLAINGDWHAAHNIVQDYNTPMACWMHAVLHKVEPDEWNSRYWYARSGGRNYEDFGDANEELSVIASCLTSLNK